MSMTERRQVTLINGRNGLACDITRLYRQLEHLERQNDFDGIARVREHMHEASIVFATLEQALDAAQEPFKL